MKSANKLAWVFSLSAILFLTAFSAKASFWKRWMKPFRGPDQNIQTLIITGNYSESRLLAELIQNTNKQPILLVPATNQENQQKIYFMPPKRRAKALQVPYSELTNFINFIGAKQIVVLGDANYVPNKYTKEIEDNQIVWRVTGDNWKKIAISAGKFLNQSNLSSDYGDLIDNLKSETNYKREKTDVQPAVFSDNTLTVTSTIEKPATDQQTEDTPIELIDASQK